MPLADARSLRPARVPEVSPLITVPFQPATDREALERLALACQTYSPLVGLEEASFPESLLLDISGCAPHFGGEEALAGQLRAEFTAWGWHSRVAVTDNVAAAWAISHFATSLNDPVQVIPSARQHDCLRSLSIAALRLSEQIQDTLHKLDIRSIQQVERLPRSALPSRFGNELQLRLDQALGNIPELITPVRHPEPLAAIWNLEEPVSSRQTLEFIARELLRQILAALQPLRFGLRELQSHFSGPQDTFLLTLRMVQPTADEQHLWQLICLEWDRQLIAGGRAGKIPHCLSNGVTAVRLIAQDTAPLRIRQETLFDLEPGRREQQAFRQFLERLRSRLGMTAVLRAQPVTDPQPELSCELQAWSDINPVANSPLTPWDQLVARSRPLRLWPQPQPLQVLGVTDGPPWRLWWSRQQSEVIHFTGPERIETGWWRERDIRRDYYRIETERGEHLWIFRCRNTHEWFLHGSYE